MKELKAMLTTYKHNFEHKKRLEKEIEACEDIETDIYNIIRLALNIRTDDDEDGLWNLLTSNEWSPRDEDAYFDVNGAIDDIKSLVEKMHSETQYDKIVKSLNEAIKSEQ